MTNLRLPSSPVWVTGYPAKFFINPEGAFLVHPSEDRSLVALEEVEAYIAWPSLRVCITNH